MANIKDLKKYVGYEFSSGCYTGDDYKSFQTKYINFATFPTSGITTYLSARRKTKRTTAVGSTTIRRSTVWKVRLANCLTTYRFKEIRK